MQTYPHILLIEDNRSIASALCEALSTSYLIEPAFSAKSGLYRADVSQFDLVLLDLQLPDMNGLEVCQLMRERGMTVPIIIISAEGKVLSKINLLDAGADDYLTKPFSLGELKARIRAALRSQTVSAHNQTTKVIFQVGDLQLDQAKHEIVRDNALIQLRKKEFQLLECLMMNAGNVVTRQQLVDFAWPGPDKPWANTIDVHIKFLRDKIDRDHEVKLIQTVHGVGYRLQAQSSIPLEASAL
jgi:two-component system, OmpR family, response regulator ArlR